jgi:heme/copper-type cytochrome/quinol oxidase subunit 2
MTTGIIWWIVVATIIIIIVAIGVFARRSESESGDSDTKKSNMSTGEFIKKIFFTVILLAILAAIISWSWKWYNSDHVPNSIGSRVINITSAPLPVKLEKWVDIDSGKKDWTNWSSPADSVKIEFKGCVVKHFEDGAATINIADGTMTLQSGKTLKWHGYKNPEATPASGQPFGIGIVSFNNHLYTNGNTINTNNNSVIGVGVQSWWGIDGTSSITPCNDNPPQFRLTLGS